MHRFVVAQLGARMHYAVPRILHGGGRLERLFTDFAVARRYRCGLGPFGRMLSRFPEGVPADRIAHFPGLAISTALAARAARNRSDYLRTWLSAGDRFCRLVLRSGLGNATGVYTFSTAALPLLEAARSRGMLAVLEQPIAPRAVQQRLLAEESAAWPGWPGYSEPAALAAELDRLERAEWAAADLILCGSEFVREGVAQTGGPVERCSVVPYGVDPGPMPAPRRPKEGPLRVLFSGAAGLRKGLPYLLEAARLLPPADFHFRIAGRSEIPPSVRLPGNVELLGALPRTAMAAQFQWADVMALPTICEGSATVCYEALAAGAPVITTPNAGSVVRDGLDGYIVPIRRPDALAERLARLAAGPALLSEMSQNAIERSRSFTVECYARRLLGALSGAAGENHVSVN